MSCLLLKSLLVIINFTLSVRAHNAEESSTVTGKEQLTTSYQKGYSITSSSSTLILAVMLVALIITGCIVCASLWLLSRRRKAVVPPPEKEGPPTPQKIDSEIINLEEFQDTGPLVMQARLRGRLRHALDNEKSHSLKEVQFDPKQNEICLIGSDVEQLVGMSQLSLMSGEKSSEAAKASKKKPVTMASEIKNAEAAAREAQRVAENERMIAICAKRRRAKEEAQRAAQAKAALEAQKKARSDESRSSGQLSGSSKTGVERGSTKPLPSSQKRSIKGQLTQTSTIGQSKRMEHVRRPSVVTSHYTRRSETSPSQLARPETSYTAQRSTHPSKSYYDETDGIGIKYQAKNTDVSTSSTSTSTASAPRRQPESEEELNFLNVL